MAILIGAVLFLPCVSLDAFAQSTHPGHAKAATTQADDDARAARAAQLTKLEAAFHGVWVGSSRFVNDVTDDRNDITSCEITTKNEFAFEFMDYDPETNSISGKYLHKVNVTAVFDPESKVANPNYVAKHQPECFSNNSSSANVYDVVIKVDPSSDFQNAELIGLSCTGQCGNLEHLYRKFRLLINGQISYTAGDGANATEVILSRN
jgi:hypothetical protein